MTIRVDLPQVADTPCAFCGGVSFSHEQILSEAADFYLCVPRGQFVPGYLMAVAHRCDGSGLRALTYARAEQIEQIAMLEEVMRTFYAAEFPSGGMTFYEQGRAGGGGTVDPRGRFPHHAHYCGIPLALDLSSVLTERFHFREVEIDGVTSLAGQPVREPYLFVRTVTPSLSRSVLYLGTNQGGRDLLESFRLKEIAAAELGIPSRGSWRAYPGDEEIDETIRRFHRFREAPGRPRRPSTAAPDTAPAVALVDGVACNPADCPFCGIATFVDRAGLYEGFTRDVLDALVLAEADGYKLLLDIAPLVPHHVLLVPNQHVTSFAWIERQAWQPLLSDVAETLREVSDLPIVVFEHGVTAKGEPGDCCISHAHLHILPAGPLPLLEAMHAWQLRPLGPGTDFQRAPYFYVRDAAGNEGFFDPSGFHSQFLRRVVAELVHRTTWHWHDYVQFTDRSAHTAALGAQIERLHSALVTSSSYFTPRTSAAVGSHGDV